MPGSRNERSVGYAPSPSRLSHHHPAWGRARPVPEGAIPAHPGNGDHTTSCTVRRRLDRLSRPRPGPARPRQGARERACSGDRRRRGPSVTWSSPHGVEPSVQCPGVCARSRLTEFSVRDALTTAACRLDDSPMEPARCRALEPGCVRARSVMRTSATATPGSRLLAASESRTGSAPVFAGRRPGRRRRRDRQREATRHSEAS